MATAKAKTKAKAKANAKTKAKANTNCVGDFCDSRKHQSVRELSWKGM